MIEPLIVLIEDSLDDATLIAHALRRHESTPEVVIFDNGRAALDYLGGRQAGDADNPSRWPHLILLDYNLPLLSGLDTLGQIRANPATRRLPVVVISGSAAPRDVHAAASLGANSYVKKPTVATDLEATILSIADYWLTLNLPPP